jgi:uncharacterized protein YndB with AHSA1/START domain
MNESVFQAKSDMMIRKPVHDVFEAFIDPAITTHFWFTHGSGRLDQQKEVTWTWAMYDLNVPVKVLRMEKNKRIEFAWGHGADATRVLMTFEAFAADKTIVAIVNDGFQGTQEEVIARSIDSTGGFTFVLAGLKAWLEHGIELNLIADKHPKGL